MKLQAKLLEGLLKIKQDDELKDKEIAGMLGISPSHWSMWKKRGEVSADYIESIYYAFPELFAEGSGDLENVGTGVPPSGKVNVISWVEAGDFNPAADPYPPGVSEEAPLYCPRSHSAYTYALRVRGDSMTSPWGKSYPEGCLIFVDPLKRSPESGDRIIAKLSGSDQVTFKVFMRDAGRVWLKPLNTQYPAINEEFQVLGTVIGKYEDE
ncbi:LexA family protein [Algiphilus sp.]|uniref:LexA family protein n=1 Tax=Algiphilus sp. TaxID=1872431 RepID=UPI003CCB8542